MNELQIAKEVFLSIIKWFLIFVVINNLIWTLIVLVNSSEIDTTSLQEGYNNNQEVIYGEHG